MTPIQGDVRLLDSDFRDAQNRRLAYLLVQDDDQMLYNFRTACGLDTKGAPAMSGWDHPDSKLRGLLSKCAASADSAQGTLYGTGARLMSAGI